MISPSFPSIIVIGGPTASGKSAVALALARRIVTQHGRAVIINADALQLYRDLHVLTARPGPADEAEIPHRLYGVLDGSERGSVAGWLDQAREEIATALEAGWVPVVVGGTGMYLHALMNGLARIPEISPAARAQAVARHAALGGRAFRAELASLDPQGAARLHDGDTQRLIRYYEVVTATGRPLGAWHAEPQEKPPPEWRFTCFVAEPARASLYSHCDNRFDTMLDRGARAEVQTLLERNLDPDLPVMKALGVPEISAWLRGDWTLPMAREKAQQATRNYAKRQLTWFRHQLPTAVRIDTTRSNEPLQLEQLAGTMQAIVNRAA